MSAIYFTLSILIFFAVCSVHAVEVNRRQTLSAGLLSTLKTIANARAPVGAGSAGTAPNQDMIVDRSATISSNRQFDHYISAVLQANENYSPENEEADKANWYKTNSKIIASIDVETASTLNVPRDHVSKVIDLVLEPDKLIEEFADFPHNPLLTFYSRGLIELYVERLGEISSGVAEGVRSANAFVDPFWRGKLNDWLINQFAIRSTRGNVKGDALHFPFKYRLMFADENSQPASTLDHLAKSNLRPDEIEFVARIYIERLNNIEKFWKEKLQTLPESDFKSILLARTQEIHSSLSMELKSLPERTKTLTQKFHVPGPRRDVFTLNAGGNFISSGKISTSQFDSDDFVPSTEWMNVLRMIALSRSIETKAECAVLLETELDIED